MRLLGPTQRYHSMIGFDIDGRRFWLEIAFNPVQ